MLHLSPAAEIQLRAVSRRLTVCGFVEKRDGVIIRCTQHDQDLTIADGDLAGEYLAVTAVTASDVKSSADLSADNLEISGLIDDTLALTGFNVADIEAGLFANAPFETFLCQWDAPNDWQKVLRRGYLGEIKRTAEGTFQAEWRGLTQVLSQQVGETYSETCDVKRFGDTRCGIDVDALELAGTVTGITDRRQFEVTFVLPPPATAGYFEIGELAVILGLNMGYTKQIKRQAGAGSVFTFTLWEAMPKDTQLGDTVSVRPGCDRRWETCTARYDNAENFRGHGRWIPGLPNIIRAP